MSEKEKRIINRISEIVGSLPEAKKERLLGVAEGMLAMKDVSRMEETKEAKGA